MNADPGVEDILDIVLVEPEIPHNTGAIARTCACTGARLHLIKPLGLDEYFTRHGDENLWLATTKAPRAYHEADLSGNVTLMFGKETAGLPLWLRERYRDKCIRIPMISEARSLNLSNSVAILAYEALRQQGFPGLMEAGEMSAE